MSFEQFPSWYRDFTRGIIDMHVHAAPDLYQRVQDIVEVSKFAKEIGYKGMIFKVHHTMNGDCAQLTRRLVPGFEAHGGMVLNHYVGGLNPVAVEAAISGGVKEIWMPVIHAAHSQKTMGSRNPVLFEVKQVPKARNSVPGITIIDEHGELKPEVSEILGMIADDDVIIGTGHVGLEEIYALLRGARKEGVKKLVVTHATTKLTGTDWPVEEQVKMAEMGAYIEYCVEPENDFRRIAECIKRVGEGHCIMATDAGAVFFSHPIDAMRKFVERMLKLGITEGQIETMNKLNPAKLLNLT